jgi:1,4-alpha-glucan branching enzyme
MDFQGFYRGNEFEAYSYLGAHVTETGVVFRTFAPAAREIAVIGDFNGWQENRMERVYDGNFWECTVPGVKAGDRYKYRIYKRDGSFLDHCDPYGFYSEVRPHNASVVWTPGKFKFSDEAWLASRTDRKTGPLNIYEIHAGSWKKRSEEEDGWYTYEELADLLVPYLKENHYGYLELMPLSEHPCDASWGYQNTGFFSPTSRYGTPDGLRRLVDACHREGIGVILDFVPVHFAVDDYALWNYDGTALYEYPHADVGRSEWGSCNFMHSRGEVRSFLQSAAWYWLKEFHFDGLRMDAVSNLLYWQGDPARGVNRDAVSFLQAMNRGLKTRCPEALLIAEDSSQYEGVTRPVDQGGLGFDYKWDLGWMNDTLSYFQSPVCERRDKYHKLTFSMMYYYNERYLLPLSHDEVVHGKAAIIQKMNGDYEKKFPQARALYLYMFAHPGKKLNFMGNELAQFREWDEKREQDWMLLSYPLHDGFHRFMRELCRFYQETPAFFGDDYERDGFVWLDCHQEGRCLYAFERRYEGQRILAVFNFSDNEQTDYVLKVPDAGSLELCLDSEWECYGGSRSRQERETLRVSEEGNAVFTLSPFSGRYYRIFKEEQKESAE